MTRVRPSGRLPHVTSTQDPSARTSMVITSPHSTKFMDRTRTMNAMVLPREFQTCVLTKFTLYPLRMTINGRLPHVTMIRLIFMNRHRIRPILMRRPHSRQGTTTTPLYVHTSNRTRTNGHRSGHLSRYRSSSDGTILGRSTSDASS